MEVRFTRTARRHRVGVTRVLAAMEAAGEPERIPAAAEGDSDLLLWVGIDSRGEELEVMAVERADGTVQVIHAMPTKYRQRRVSQRRMREDTHGERKG